MSELNKEHWRVTTEIVQQARIETIEECALIAISYHHKSDKWLGGIVLEIATAIRKLKNETRGDLVDN